MFLLVFPSSMSPESILLTLQFKDFIEINHLQNFLKIVSINDTQVIAGKIYKRQCVPPNFGISLCSVKKIYDRKTIKKTNTSILTALLITKLFPQDGRRLGCLATQRLGPLPDKYLPYYQPLWSQILCNLFLCKYGCWQEVPRTKICFQTKP